MVVTTVLGEVERIFEEGLGARLHLRLLGGFAL
jgi:hypothetical protein